MSMKQKLHQMVIEQQQELIELVSDLIKIPSENPTGEQTAVVSFVQKYLAEAQIQSQKVAADPQYPCLLAQIGSEGGFSIICNGHVDVVPAGERSGWDFDPFGGEITEKTIRGRGTSDMKAGVAGLLFVMKLLKQFEGEMKGNIRLHIVSDEETGGEYGTEWLCSQGYAKGGNACLVAEPTSNDNIEIGQKGIAHMTLKSHGIPAHGSLGNYVGDNAVIKLSKVLPHINELTSVPGHFAEHQAVALRNSRLIATRNVGEKGADAIDHLTANVGIITGGTKINMVPDYCEAKVDMRLPIGISKEDIRTAVEEMITRSGVTGVEADIDFMAEPNYTSYDAEIVTTVKKYAEQIWGHEVLPAYQWASSDAKYYREQDIPTIQFGPSNTKGIHSYNEDVDIEDVVHCAEIYMLAFCELLGIQ